MKCFLKILFLILTLSSCKNQSDLKETEQLLETDLTFSVLEIDSLLENGLLNKKLYPNKSGCGGALDGFYFNNELVLIDSKYKGELGFSGKKIYFQGNQILKIKYREHFAEWTKYEKNNPPAKVDFDPNKMTYSDTIYEITFGEEYEFKKMAYNKLISTKTDSTLVERLTDCGKRMKTELESINE